ncbi:MAG: hypothetical protein U0075_09880 [Thermomicrobiales bacterium]
MAPIELRLPFGLLSSDDVQRYLRAGIPLRLQIAYRDASKNVHHLEECFTFARASGEHGERAVALPARFVPVLSGANPPRQSSPASRFPPLTPRC